MVNYISNDKFKYLSPDDRDILKKNYNNYLFLNGRKTFYIQDKDEYWFFTKLNKIRAKHGDDISVYMNDKLGKKLDLIQDEESLELF